MIFDPVSLARACCSRSLGLVALAALACGPESGGDSDDGASSAESDGSADGPSTGSDASASADASASGSGSASGDDSSASVDDTADGSGSADDGSGDDGSCPPNSVPVEPGCEPPGEGAAVVEAGCYEPCDTVGAPCGDGGVCGTAWVNPCVCPEGEDCCAACGGESTLCLQAGATGAACTTDEQCASGVCWDFSDYDRCCAGTACSGACETNEDCVALATDAGAKSPENATCSKDGRCSLVGTGLGSWACAGPPCG